MSENIQVPNGWEVKKLGEVAEKVIQKNTINNDNVLTISAQYGLINQKDFFYKKIASNDTSSYYLIKQNDFAYNKSYSIDYPYGAIKRLTLYDNGVVSTLYICFRFVEKNIDILFMEQYFETQLFNKYIYSVAQEGARNHGLLNITNYDFFNMPIPVPPLEEQKKIAEILMLWDKAIEQTKELITYKEKQKKGLMQLLLTGKKRLDGFTDEWKTVKLGEVVEMSSGGTPTTSKEEYYNGNINWVSITDITSSYKYLYKTKIRITELGLKNSSAKLFPINTVLFAMYASIGECIIAKEEMATSQAILGIRCSDSLNYEYLFYLLYNYKENSKKLAQQGTQANLNKEIVENFIFKIPTSFSEQKAIAEVLSKADEEIELLNKQLELYTEQKKGLMQNLLTGKVRV